MKQYLTEDFVEEMDHYIKMANTIFGMMYSQLLQERVQKEGEVSVKRRIPHNMAFCLDTIKQNARDYGIKCRVRTHKKHMLLTMYTKSSFNKILGDPSVLLPGEAELFEND